MEQYLGSQLWDHTEFQHASRRQKQLILTWAHVPMGANQSSVMQTSHECSNKAVEHSGILTGMLAQ